MKPAGHAAAVSASRALLLDAIGSPENLTFVRGPGTIGDHLIWAGARALLAHLPHREILADEVPASSGDTAVITGSGGFCRGHHAWMPVTLRIAERRFDRVIVLPSSFDVGEDVVADTLAATRATVFAREAPSFEQIESLCDARLAHDCAFFLDLELFERPGSGTLNAFSDDGDAGGELFAAGNDDISLNSPSVEAFVAEIAARRTIRTDRADVLIAAALLGKRVDYAPGAYHDVEGIARHSLAGFPVRPIAAPRRPRLPLDVIDERGRATIEELRAAALPGATSAAPGGGGGAPRVTAVVVTRDRPDLLRRCVRSILASATPTRLVLLDNNSDPRARPALTALAADPRVELLLSPRNLGCAGGRSAALASVETEFVLMLDDDAELVGGALEHLLADLDAHPEATASGALVVDPRGSVQIYGGSLEVVDGVAGFRAGGTGVRFDDPLLPPTGRTGWVCVGATLIRLDALRRLPFDPEMAAYYEDNEWCLRVARAEPGSFRRCREALVLHHAAGDRRFTSTIAGRSVMAERLRAHARFLEIHDVVLRTDLVEYLPELRRGPGELDVPLARRVLAQLTALGPDRFVTEWMNGGLVPLIGEPRHRAEELSDLVDELEWFHAEKTTRDGYIGELEARLASIEQYARSLAAELAAREAAPTAPIDARGPAAVEANGHGGRALWAASGVRRALAAGWRRARSRASQGQLTRGGRN